jgi:uncharacterized protein with GYD domain
MMSTFIISGSYSYDGIKGMMANPSDREAAVRPLIDGMGAKFVSYYVTTGAHDFQLTVETDDPVSLMSALIVAGAGGGVTNLQTVQAFSAAEFMAAQKKAGAMAASFKSAGQ